MGWAGGGGALGSSVAIPAPPPEACVPCAAWLFPAVLPLWFPVLLWAAVVLLVLVLLWAKALPTGSTRRIPHRAEGTTFISTLFPARRLCPRAWLFVTVHRLDAKELRCLSQFLFDPQ